MATATTINDFVKGYDKNTKDIDALNNRVSSIVANNGNGNKDSEIIDARNGKLSLRDRINEVENKIDENNDKMTKEIVDARVDFDGGIHKNLNLRLLEDFNNLYKLIYNSTLIPYEGQYITANNSYKGMTEDMQIKGRTLQNLLKSTRNDILVKYGAVATWKLFKPNTTYTIKITNKSTETKQYFFNEYCFTLPTEITLSPNQTLIIKISTLTSFTQAESVLEILLKNKIDHTQPNNLDIVALEGDYINKTIPYFEGIRGVGETGENLEVISCSKNLININTLTQGWINTTTGVFETNNNRHISSFIRTGNKQSVVISRSNLNTVSTIWMYKYDINKKYIESVPLLNPGITTNTISPNCQYIKLGVPYPTIEEINTLKLQLEDGTASTNYEQYKEHRQTIPLTEPIRSLPNDVRDVVDFKKCAVVRNVGKLVLNGNESLIKADAHSTATHTCFICRNTGVATNEPFVGISSHFIFKSVTNVRDDEGIQFGGATPYGDIYIRIANSKLTTIDIAGFKAWLQANPVTVYYQLATPIETPMELIPIRIYEGVTNIFTEGSLIEPTIKCKISTDVNSVIKTLQAVNARLTMVIQQNNLNTIALSVDQEARLTKLELGVI